MSNLGTKGQFRKTQRISGEKRLGTGNKRFDAWLRGCLYLRKKSGSSRCGESDFRVASQTLQMRKGEEGDLGYFLSNLEEQADVVLRGYSGYNTRWALRVLGGVLSSVDSQPAALTIFFGANDASLPDRSSAFQHVPVDEYRQNLVDLISRIKVRWGSTLIVLITPPPIDEDARLRDPYGGIASGLPERTNHCAGLYTEACISAGGDSGVPVIDLWSKMQTVHGWEKAYLRDGLHLTADGNKVVFDELVETLKKEGLSMDSIPCDLPLLSEIDPRDPLKSFVDPK